MDRREFLTTGGAASLWRRACSRASIISTASSTRCGRPRGKAWPRQAETIRILQCDFSRTPVGPLPARPFRCYLITMARLASLLIMFALVITSGPAIASAMCRHADAVSHASALQSTDRGVSAAAADEETAAAATGRKGTLADLASVQLAGFVTPAQPALYVPLARASLSLRAVDDDSPPGRSPRPLLEPPLA